MTFDTSIKYKLILLSLHSGSMSLDVGATPLLHHVIYSAAKMVCLQCFGTVQC